MNSGRCFCSALAVGAVLRASEAQADGSAHATPAARAEEPPVQMKRYVVHPPPYVARVTYTESSGWRYVDTVTVVSVVRPGPAAAAGLKEGMEIVALNGIRLGAARVHGKFQRGLTDEEFEKVRAWCLTKDTMTITVVERNALGFAKRERDITMVFPQSVRQERVENQAPANAAGK